jgi:hypothetical protein
MIKTEALMNNQNGVMYIGILQTQSMPSVVCFITSSNYCESIEDICAIATKVHWFVNVAGPKNGADPEKKE